MEAAALGREPQAPGAPRAWDPGEIPVLLGRLLTGHFSGRLELTAESGEAVQLRFALGELIGSASREELAHHVLASGRVPGVELASAVETALQERRRLSAVLHEVLGIDQTELRDALGSAIRSALTAVLSGASGSWQLTPGFDAAPPAEEVALGLPTRDLLLDACRWAGIEGVRAHLGGGERIPRLSDHLLPPDLPLNADERFLLSRVGDALSLREVLSLAPAGCDPERSLLGLACVGLVELRVPEPGQTLPLAERRRRDEIERLAARLPGRTAYETLGVEPDASWEEVRAAYTRAVRRFHPDGAGDTLADLRPQLQSIITEVVSAYRTLESAADRAAGIDPPGPTSAAPRAPEPEAAHEANPPPGGAPPEHAQPVGDFVENGLIEARALYGQKRFWDAIQLLDAILSRAVGEWGFAARLLRAQCYAENRLWRHSAEEELKELARERPADAGVLFELARLYARAGLRRRAMSSLRQALRRDPGHARARIELASLESASAGLVWPHPPRPASGEGRRLG